MPNDAERSPPAAQSLVPFLIVLLALLYGWLGLLAIGLEPTTTAGCQPGEVIRLGQQCVDPGGPFLTIVGLVTLCAALFRRAWWVEYVLMGLGALVVGAALAGSIRPPLPDPQAGSAEVEIRLKADDLGASVAAARPGERVALVVDAAGEGARRQTFSNLTVVGLFAMGHSVAYSGESPDSLVFRAPASQATALLQALQARKSVYLIPQTGPTPTTVPLATPVATSTVAQERAAFRLPAAKINSDLRGLRRADPVTILIVEEPARVDGQGVVRPITRYERAQVLDFFDTNGRPLLLADASVASVRVAIARGADDSAAQQFARSLTGAQSIYLLPSP